MKQPSHPRRPNNRSRPINWKRWLTLVFLSVATGFILHQVREMIARHPPWLQVRKIIGPALPNDNWSSSLRQFQSLVDEVQQEAGRRHLLLGPVRLCEVRKGNPETIVWILDQFTNPGFDAQSRFQCELSGSTDRLIGYYTLDGKPLPTIIRQLSYLGGSHPDVECSVAPPVPPGGKLFTIRVERGLKIVKSANQGAYFLSLGQLPPTNAVIAAQAVHLPHEALIIQYSPGGVPNTLDAGLQMVTWLNSSVEASNAALSLLFKWSS